MKKLLLIVPGIFVIFLGCEKKIEEKLIGCWTIEELYYDNKNVMTYFYSHAIIVKKDSCELPIFDWNQRHTSKEYGLWSVHSKNNKNYFKIKTENSFFNDTYEIIKIWKDCNDNGCLYRMTLRSDSTYMNCVRHDFESSNE